MWYWHILTFFAGMLMGILMVCLCVVAKDDRE